MEGKKNIGYIARIITFMALASYQTGFAASHYSEKIYDAYIRGNIAAWIPIITLLENTSGRSFEGHLELVNYYYGYTGYLVSVNKDELAEIYIEKAGKLLDKILILSPDNPTAYAYMGSFIGFKIGMDKYKAPYLGPKSIEYINKSITMDPNNMQGYLEKGNASFYTPSIFGGSKEEAIRYYNKAIRMMENTDQVKGNWLYLNSLTLLAQAYEKTDRVQEAEKVYQKILKIEPEFVWVRDELYPNFRKKL